MSSVALTTTLIDTVITTWADKYIEDVPARHENGDYLIEYHDLLEHLTNLEYETLSNILLEVHEKHIAGSVDL